MRNIVITGSTRGIGFGLADAFLARGCRVVVNGRAPASVQRALTELSQRHLEEHMAGFAASVNDYEQVQALWNFATEQWGSIDIWINNAGVGHETDSFWDIKPEDAKAVTETNVLGTFYGAKVAMQGMVKQGGGQIYNMEGFGSRGNVRPGMSLYGTSKAAIHYLTKAMVEEAEGSAVLVGSLAPGMVMTDLVLDRFKDDPESLDNYKRIFNIIADSVDNVSAWLADHILSNQKHGARLDYLPPVKMAGRFLMSPFNKRDLFAD